MLPILEASGLKVEQDFFLAHSPERVDPGNKRLHHQEHEQGGRRRRPATRRRWPSPSTRRPSTTSSPSRSAKAAEMVKVYENTFRAVNIALVNEMRAALRPHGPERLGSAGRGVHQAVRHHAVLSRGRASAGTASRSTRTTWSGRPASSTSTRTSSPWPARSIARCRSSSWIKRRASSTRCASRSPRAAYWSSASLIKADISDCRESPALAIVHGLLERGAQVSYHDELVPRITVDGTTLFEPVRSRARR